MGAMSGCVVGAAVDLCAVVDVVLSVVEVAVIAVDAAVVLATTPLATVVELDASGDAAGAVDDDAQPPNAASAQRLTKAHPVRRTRPTLDLPVASAAT